MLFGHHKIDSTIDEYFQNIYLIASDQATLVFLDTNILAYLFKLHTSARHEFFDWLDQVAGQNRLAIPAWAASEYLNRVTSKGLAEFTPKSKEPAQIVKALDAMHDTAALFVDVPLLQKLGMGNDRAAFLSDFRSAIESLKNKTRVFTEQFDPGHIHDEIVNHLESSIMDSDLIELSKRAAENGGARYENRIPPGYLDGDKEKNRFGDLIIWYEILDKSKASVSDFEKVLFVSNDEKSDWVYAPKMRCQIVAGVRKPIGNNNPEIKIADPRLLSEFKRMIGHSELSVCSLATLIEALSKVNASNFVQLAAAIQINIDESNTNVPSNSEEAGIGTGAEAAHSEAAHSSAEVAQPEVMDNSEQVSESAVEVELTDNIGRVSNPEPLSETDQSAGPNATGQQTFSYSIHALSDNLYPANGPTEIDGIIRSLKSHNWYTQNPAISKIKFIRDQLFNPSSWFVLGRNIYQAACGNSQKAMEFMAALDVQLGQFPEPTAQHLLSGMLFEIYFDSSADFRRILKFAYADQPLSLAANPRYAQACNFIRSSLLDYADRLKFLPGDRDAKRVIVTSAPQEQTTDISKRIFYKLESVVVDEVETVRQYAGTPMMWGQIDGGSMLTFQNLRDTLAEELAIPRWALDTYFHPGVPPDVRFVVPEGYVFYPKWAVVVQL